ncbi:MAG: sugar ABC transporter permease [Planctomycetota bacterium]
MNDFLFLFPFLSLFLLFLGWPVLYSFYLSFYETTLYTDWYNVFSDMRYVGLKNYEQLLQDPQFYWSLFLTLYYTLLTVPTQIFISLGLAILLRPNFRGKIFFRTAFFLPHILDTLIVGSIWLYLLAPQGWIAQSLAPFLEKESLLNTGLLNHSWTVLPTIAFVMALKVSGFGMILFLVVLQRIPQEYYESAKLDGASSWGQFRYITFPFLKPIIFFLAMTGTLMSINAFTEIYAMTNATGGPALQIAGQTVTSAKISGYYLFQQFEDGKYGYAAALSYLLFLLAMILSWGYARLLKISKNGTI